MIKTISVAHSSGYVLNMPTYSELSITSAGSVGPLGVALKETGTLVDAGHIGGAPGDGVEMQGGGVVANTGTLDGYIGVWAPNVSEGGGGATTSVSNSGVLEGEANGVQLMLGGDVTNSGTISETNGGYSNEPSNAVYVLTGAVTNTGKLIASYNKAAAGFHSGVEIGSGTVANGAQYGSHTSLITGYYGVTAIGTTTVTNFATISGASTGIQFEKGGTLVNGGTYETTALVKGDFIGVSAASGRIANYAAIKGGLTGVSFGGSNLVNGASFDPGALIQGGRLGLDSTSAASTIMNWGTIEGVNPAPSLSQGVQLHGGSLTNGAATDTSALIKSFDGGVDVYLGGTVTNFGEIGATYGAIGFSGGGRLTNSSAGSRAALIEGYSGAQMTTAAGTVTNFGTIRALGASGSAFGVYLEAGGAVTNGALSDRSAEIRGQTGVELGAVGTVINYGAIDAATYDGVRLAGGGRLVNGAATDPDALVDGYFGVVLVASGTVDNFGTVESWPGTAAAVHEAAGGGMVNGAAGDRTALLVGGQGASFTGGAGTLANYATITGESGAGVLANDGVSVTNGGGADRVALIQGDDGVDVSAGLGAITNFATMVGLGGSGFFGAELQAGGAFVNGSINDHAALVQGYGGAEILGPGASTNFGTLQGLGAATLGFGLDLAGNGDLTNGAATDTSALIEGYFGAELGGAGTLTNFGTILGANGVAVQLTSPTATLAVEAGSTFLGSVTGDGGTLDLASGVGTLTGLVSSRSVRVSGSMAATTFADFNTVRVAAGASFTMSGAADIAAGQSVIDSGTLTINSGVATFINAGTVEAVAGALVIDSAVQNTGAMVAFGGNLTVEGAVTGAGTVRIGAGTADFVSTFAENVVFGSSGVLELSHSQAYTGDITGFSKTGSTSLDLVDIAFGSKTTAKFAGSTTSGVLTITDGTHTAKITLEGDYVGSTFKVASDGHGGTTVVDPTKPAAPHFGPAPVVHPFVAAAASFAAPTGGRFHVSREPWRSSYTAIATPRP